jgi:hypothetical protein
MFKKKKQKQKIANFFENLEKIQNTLKKLTETC